MENPNEDSGAFIVVLGAVLFALCYFLLLYYIHECI